jgi:hypothetical protein
MGMFLVDRRRRLPMCGAIIFHDQTENKHRENENNHAFFFPGEDETLLELVELPARRKFQWAGSSFTRGRTRTER